MEEDLTDMLKNSSVCTLGLALAAMLNPGISLAQSHCKGLEEALCKQTQACRWQAEAKAGDKTRAGTERKRSTRAHCRLDIRRASEIIAKMR